MLNLLLTISVILIIAAGLSQLINAILGLAAKDDVKDRLETIWLNYSEASPSMIIQMPLHLLNLLFELMFGKRSISRQSLFRASAFSISVLICSLLITGWFTHTNLGMEKLPWQYYKDAMDSARELSQLPDRIKSAPTKPQNSDTESEEELNKYIKKRWQVISKLDTLGWKIFYSVFFVIFLFATNALLDAVSLSITRLMLNEIVQTNSIVMITSILLINLLLALFLSTITLFLAVLISHPFIIIEVLILVVILFAASPSLTSVGVFGAAVVAWKLTGAWFKVVALTTILPSILLCIVLSLSILLYPMRKKIYSLFSLLLLRAIDHDKGIFTFVAGFLLALGGIIGGVVKLLQ